MVAVLVLSISAVAKPISRRADCPGYEATNVLQADSYLLADLQLLGNCTLYAKDITNLRLLVEYQTDTRLHVLISDSDNNVFQVPDQVLHRPHSQNSTADTSAIRFTYKKNPFSFTVTRVSTGEVLFDTSAAPLIFETQYVRLRTRLPTNPNLYGLGEHSDDFRLGTTGYTRTLWNAEAPFIPRNQNLYGSHPIYFDHRGSAGTHGVFLLSASGMDIKIDKTEAGEQYLEYNTIGGVLDFYFFAGPEPTAVTKQYADVVGLPAMMPYWTLGFHQCKYGWKTVDFVAEVVAKYAAANIPLETVWGDIDYMGDHKDFSTDPVNYTMDKLQKLISSLHANKQHYVQIVDPGIGQSSSYPTFARGAEQGVFLRSLDGFFYTGYQWAGKVVWPDWFAPNTQAWWTAEIERFYDPTTGIDVEGLWTDMNEASNMCDQSCFNREGNLSHAIPQLVPSIGPMKGLPGRDLLNPGYHIRNRHGGLSVNALWTNISNADGTYQYDTHNLYGTMMARATRSALVERKPTKRPFLLTRSTFAGAGRYAAHWFGDNYSAWDDYRIAIKQMLAFTSMHQMSMVGSDVCGFNGVAQPVMCARWAALGAFQPFYRNHADTSAPEQEFYLWPIVADSARKAINARYRLLDYIYTAMNKHSTYGDPVASPLWFKYPADTNTFDIQTQWFFGDALLVSPVVDDDSTSVTYYLPDDVFYDFWTLKPVRGRGASVTANDVGWSDIPVHIRGGSIVPLRAKSGYTTADVRSQNFTIIVAPGIDGNAQGSMYLDDGESLDVGTQKSEIQFYWDGALFVCNGTFGYPTDVWVEHVTILGGGNNGSALSVGKQGGIPGGFGPWRLNRSFFVFRHSFA
ncbi:glycosyl hydrolases family 31-domain-containing protein [Podospora didyma]|uniref:alpha-glucosidase n=1 Tax=Podospora didyma TaxID=330526 RepID=A0AAE0NR59_9PEZI|nr:glycosyl hydrolases family 31-domain-containing protein [Podospora didyma]